MENVKLKELVDIFLGVTHTPEYVFGGVPFLSVKDISDGEISFDDCKYISQEEYDSLSEGAKPKVGDMLFCRVGTLGKPIIIPEGTPLFGSFVSLGYLRNKDASRCDMNYLRYWMYSNSFWQQVNANVKGASQVNLNTGWLSKFDVVLPEMEQQKYRIATLDQCNMIIRKRKQQIEELDTLIKARFVELFGDPICNSKGLPLTKGDSFFKLSNGKFVPEAKRFEEGIPVYGGNGISWYTDEALLQEDTIVVGRVGFQSGNVHYAEGPLMISDNAMYISWYDSEKYDLLFLCYLMEHIDFKRLQDAGDLKKITQKPFMSMDYIQPSLEQQYIYKSFVKQVDKSKVAVQKALDETQLLFNSLMQEYFG